MNDWLREPETIGYGLIALPEEVYVYECADGTRTEVR
jgi:hypothetical protein